MAKKKSPIVLDDWIDRDLTASLAELPPAFEIDDTLRQVEEILLAGPQRSPVLVGRPGVGKTAVFHQLVRRIATGQGPESLHGARVVQIGLGAIAGRFPPNTGKATDFAQRFFDHLLVLDQPVIPLIRDIHVAYMFDWEAILHRYLSRSQLPILGEAQPRGFDELVEYWGELSNYLVPITVEEPTAERTRAIVRQWNGWSAREGERPFTAEAQSIAIELTARYMGDRAFPRKVLDLLKQTRVLSGGAEAEGPVDVQDVVGRFSAVTRVPPSLVDPRVRLELDDVQSFLANRLLGQEEAVDALVRMIALIKAGLTDLTRPFGVLMFVGPTGVGKTHAAQLMAEYLFGDRQRLIRINMTDYTQPQHFQVLFGDPNGQNLAQRRGVLATRLVGHPFGVLLLDEFEKANPRVHDGFLQLIDEGRFINGMGETVSATSMISSPPLNAGVEVFRETAGLPPGTATCAAWTPSWTSACSTRSGSNSSIVSTMWCTSTPWSAATSDPSPSASCRSCRGAKAGPPQRGPGGAMMLDWLVRPWLPPHFGARFLRREIERNVTAPTSPRPPLFDDVIPELGVRWIASSCARWRTPSSASPSPAPTSSGRSASIPPPWRWRPRPGWSGSPPWPRSRPGAPPRPPSSSKRQPAPGLRDAPRWPRPLSSATRLTRAQADARLLDAYRRTQALLRRPPGRGGSVGAIEEMAVSYRWPLARPGHRRRPGRRLAGHRPRRSAGRRGRQRPARSRQHVRRPVPPPGLPHRGLRWRGRRAELVRVVFEVEGAGVLRALELEQGRHRRKRGDGQHRDRWWTCCPSATRASPLHLPDGVRVADARHAHGTYAAEPHHRPPRPGASSPAASR
ncbi:MAG: AAA family ATPase [bacterium]